MGVDGDDGVVARVRLAVAVGGAVGSVGRVAIGRAMDVAAAGAGGWAVVADLPWATLFVNVTGAFALALLGRHLSSPVVRAAVLTGAIGAWTTVSTLAVEVLDAALLGGRAAAAGATYLVVSVAAGVLAVRLGERVSRRDRTVGR